jgi:hypothetical protein
MKDAYVLVAHAGDRGRLDEGDVVLDLSNNRFEDLEKLGLVREATGDEVKNWQPRFVAEAKQKPQATTIVIDVDDLSALRARLDEQGEAIIIAIGERDDARQQLDQVIGELAASKTTIEEHVAMVASLTEERDEARAALSAATAQVGGEKVAESPENKHAPAPENKQATSPKTKA